MRNFLVRLVGDEAGQDLIEYALLCTVVSLVVFAFVTQLGTNLNNWYFGLTGATASMPTTLAS